MDFLDIIGTILEYTQKGEEFSDEIKTIKVTLESLRLTIQQVGHENLPGHLTKMLQDNLSDAEALLSKTSAKPNWWKNIKNMLPGSDLFKIKDKNVQLQQCINLLNLHLNAIKNLTTKRSANYIIGNGCKEDYDIDMAHTYKKMKTIAIESGIHNHSHSVTKCCVGKRNNSDTGTYNSKGKNLRLSQTISSLESNGDDIAHAMLNDARLSQMATLEDNVIDPFAPTQKEDDHIGKGKYNDYAFELKFMYDEKIISKNIQKTKDYMPSIKIAWNDKDTAEYILKRSGFCYLPGECPAKISREHCKIIATRTIKSAKTREELLIASTIPENDNFEVNHDDSELADNKNSNDLYRYELVDLSTNGTFYLRKKDNSYTTSDSSFVTFKGSFKQVPKDAPFMIENQDIICIIIKRPGLQELIFGFEFRISS